jgi:hypothetical protein
LVHALDLPPPPVGTLQRGLQQVFGAPALAGQ